MLYFNTVYIPCFCCWCQSFSSVFKNHFVYWFRTGKFELELIYETGGFPLHASAMSGIATAVGLLKDLFTLFAMLQFNVVISYDA